MSKSITTQVASFFLAVLMTAASLASVQDCAKAESRIGAANALVALVAQAAPSNHQA
jgi:hypothetical protein